EVQADRVEEGGADGFGRVGRWLAGLEAPVAAETESLRVEGEVVSRRQAPDPGEEGLVRVVEVALLEVVADDGRVRLEPVVAERARLAREGEAVAVEAVVERLDPKTVA